MTDTFWDKAWRVVAAMAHMALILAIFVIAVFVLDMFFDPIYEFIKALDVGAGAELLILASPVFAVFIIVAGYLGWRGNG